MSDNLKKVTDTVYQLNLDGSHTQVINNFVQNPSLPIPECPTNIKPPSNKIKFVGREKDVENIHETLQIIEKPLAITAVAGMSGVGKSELALQYAHEYKAEYPGGICFLSASQGQSSVLTDLVQFMLSKFQVRVPDDAKDWSDVDIAQYFWDQWRTPGNILLIFDDVKNYGDIEGLLPNNQRFQVLLTTQIDFSASGHVDSYPLEVLKRDKSLELLEKSFIGADRLSAEAEIADQLCAYLGDLPLGLVLAGQYLKESPKLPLIKYWERLQNTKIDHLSLNPDPKNVIRDERTKRGVIAAFQLTWQRIGEINPQSQELAGYFSLYALAPIPFTIDYDDDPSAEEKEQAFNTLLQWHILTPSDQYENSYKLHNLMREFLQNKLTELPNGEKLKQQFVGRMINIAQQIEQTVTNEIITNVSPYIEHIIEVANNYVEYLKNYFIDDLIRPYTSLAWFYEGQSLYAMAEDWKKQCLTVAEKNLPANHSDISTSYNNLANLYQKQGKSEQAQTFYFRTSAINEKSLPADHPDLARDYNNSALFYQSQGEYNKAETLYENAITIIKKSLPANHPSLATVYSNLAGLYKFQRKYKDAEILYLEAITIIKKSLPNYYPSLASVYNSLAELYREQGKYKLAEPLYLKAISIDEEFLPSDNSQLSYHLNNLGGLYYFLKRYEDAEPLFLSALENLINKLGIGHPKTQQCRMNLIIFWQKAIDEGRAGELKLLYVHPLGKWVLENGGE